jgi:hypothetical protein
MVHKEELATRQRQLQTLDHACSMAGEETMKGYGQEGWRGLVES